MRLCRTLSKQSFQRWHLLPKEVLKQRQNHLSLQIVCHTSWLKSIMKHHIEISMIIQKDDQKADLRCQIFVWRKSSDNTNDRRSVCII